MGSFVLGMQTQPRQQKPTMQMLFEWHNLEVNNRFLLMQIGGGASCSEMFYHLLLWEIFKNQLEKTLSILV